MRPTARHIVSILTAASAVSCGGGQTYFGPPARPGAVITGFSEPVRDRAGFELFLRNDSEGDVDITGIALYDCENVRGGCIFWDPDLVLRPGQITRVKVVEPAARGQGFTYRWRWTYNRLAVTDSVAGPSVHITARGATELLDLSIVTSIPLFIGQRYAVLREYSPLGEQSVAVHELIR